MSRDGRAGTTVGVTVSLAAALVAIVITIIQVEAIPDCEGGDSRKHLFAATILAAAIGVYGLVEQLRHGFGWSLAVRYLAAAAAFGVAVFGWLAWLGRWGVCSS
jgi:hypothetical protein